MCSDLLSFTYNPILPFLLFFFIWFAGSKSCFSIVLGKLVGGNEVKIKYILASLFIVYVSNNLLGLLPFCTSLTTDISVVIFTRLAIWLSSLLLRITDFTPFFSSLIPSGTPWYLAPFICVIELVRLFIRPLSLSIRLVANMVAGHVVLSLLSELILMTPSVFLFYTLYYIIEVRVALIQTYIYCLLLMMYENI